MEDNKSLRHSRFRRIVEKRVQNTLNEMERIRKCANTYNYYYEEKEVFKIIQELNKKIREIKTEFDRGLSKQLRKKFKL